MTTETKPGASRAAFFAAASTLPMLRGPTITYAPEDDGGAGGEANISTDDTDQDQDRGEQQSGEGEPQSGEGESEGGEQQPRRNPTQERIDALTKSRREAERRAAAAEARLAELDKPKGEQPTAPAEPDPSKYKFGETDPQYIRDLARFEAKQAYADEAKAHSQRTAQEAVLTTWDQRQDAFAATKPDYYDKVTSNDLPITPVMADAIMTSEDGAAVAYHLANHPDEARRIAAMNPLAAVRELGRLEAKLAQPPANSTPDPKTISDAPRPAPNLRGNGGRFKVAPDTDDFSAFEKQYGA